MSMFRVWCPDDEAIEDAEIIYASSVTDAAEIHVSSLWDGFTDSYDLVVADEQSIEWKVTVDVDIEPHYTSYARKIK